LTAGATGEINNNLFLLAMSMPKKIQPAITTIKMSTDPSGSSSTLNFVDTARELSKVNRRLYSQSRLYGYQGLTFIWRASGNLATIEATVSTAGNTWIVQNAHVKGHALWNQMQELVLEDNPSIAGKWHDYKIRLDGQQLDVASGEYKGVAAIPMGQ
jgi:hypothetical protein